MDIRPQVTLDASSEIPLYRQLADSIGRAIRAGVYREGTRLPATRELAGQLGLNRTTVSAAYAALEEAGLLEGQVGRGSFVAKAAQAYSSDAPIDWDVLLGGSPALSGAQAEPLINFSTSRPAAEAFPLEPFRRLARAVIEGPEAADILQLGSPYGYRPLRRYLLQQGEAAGWVRPGDDLIVTNGCQQALDLLARVLVRDGTPVLVEDPVYHGLLRVFERAGAQLLPVPVGEAGIDIPALEAAIAQYRPPVLLVTPEFQNPTGATLGLEQRAAIVQLAQRHGLAVIESEIYRRLRYVGQPLPSLKQLDTSGHVISIGSYSKVAFPGLRVGWVVAPHAVVARLAEAKQISDLHSDQLSQAVLLRFAESGELQRHLEQTKHDGAARLRTALASCERYLPPGARFTRPEGGMSLWIEFPAPLLAEDLLEAAAEDGVRFLPGPYFSARGEHRRSLRLSFGGLTPQQIAEGVAILGRAAAGLLGAHHTRAPLEPVAAVV